MPTLEQSNRMLKLWDRSSFHCLNGTLNNSPPPTQPAVFVLAQGCFWSETPPIHQLPHKSQICFVTKRGTLLPLTLKVGHKSCFAELPSINITSRDTGLVLSQCQFKETSHQTQPEMQIKAEFMKCSSEEKGWYGSCMQWVCSTSENNQISSHFML